MRGRVAVVAGGARNIGAAIARLFAAEGATVIIGDLREDEGRALAEELGDTATFSGLDVTDEASWTRLVESTETRFGPVSVLVNNAAIIPFAHLADMDTACFDRCLAVNVRGTFLGMRALAGSMTRAGGGSIINLSSVQGLVGLEGTGGVHGQQVRRPRHDQGGRVGARPTRHTGQLHPPREDRCGEGARRARGRPDVRSRRSRA